MKRILLLFLCFCCTLTTTAQITDYVTDLVSPVGIVKNDNTLFIAAVGSSQILKVDMTATNPVAEEFLNNISFPTKMLLIGNDLYFTSLGIGGVAKVDITAINPVYELVVSGLDQPFGLALKDNELFVGLRSAGEIVKFDYTQTNPVVESVASGLGSFMNDITFYGNDLYVARGQDGIISKIDVTQSSPTLIDVVAAPGVLEVNVEGDKLYYTNDYINTLDLSNPSATPETLLSNITSVWDLIIEDDYLLAAQQTDGIILRVNLNPNDVPISERNALMAFYNATNGDDWFDNTNWNTLTPVSSWAGIFTTTTDLNGQPFSDGLEHITGINFFVNNNLTGTLPSELEDLTKLRNIILRDGNLTGNIPNEVYNLPDMLQIQLHNNNMSGIISPNIQNLSNLQVFDIRNNSFSGILPDLTGLSELSFLVYQNNLYQFGDFENEFSFYQSNISNHFYAPQKPLTPFEDVVIPLGSNLTFNANVSGANNNYFWFKRNPNTGGGTLISNDENFTLTINSTDDYGDYWLEVNSNIVNNLLLSSPDFTVAPEPSTQPDYPALVALYNSTNGDNWTNNTNWLDDTKPISTWYAVSFDNISNRVIGLSLGNNNLMGSIPSEIGQLTQLSNLSLNDHNLSGEIPIELWDLDLETLQLQNTFVSNESNLEFTNTTATTFENFTNPTFLRLSDMSLPNQAYSEILAQSSIFSLWLINCELGSTLPDQFASITSLNLSENNFQGEIPQAYVTSTGNFSITLNDNLFDFSDLEPLATANNYTVFNYSPQRTLDNEESITIANEQNVTFNVNDTNINRNVNDTAMNNEYQWFKDEQAISGANANTYTITNTQETDSGIYHCEITNTILPDLIIRRADITLTIDNSLSNEEVINNNIKIYPNPVRNWLNLNLGQNADYDISIIDITGKVVLTRKTQSNIFAIDVSNLSNGIYMLNISSKTEQITKKIIKK